MSAILGQQMGDLQEGQILEGEVVGFAGDDVVIEVGLKSEGLVPKEEFDGAEVKIGDKIKVLLDKIDGEGGLVQISKRKADRQINWQRLVDTTREGDVIEGKVTRKIKGGLLVDIGVPAFLPASQVDVRRPAEIGDYIGRTVRASVLKIDLERRNIVVSRRKLIEEERESAKKRLMETLKEGEIVPGEVKNIADFGAFIDLGGIDGLLHITDMSWGRLTHPSEMLKVGQEIDVVVLDINREKERVSLGLKQKEANPWDSIESKFPLGAKVKGKVVNLVPYGAFVELEPGVEGLVHVTELSWTKRIAKPSDVLKVGQEIEAVVLGINREEQKISLGVRQLETNPWDVAHTKYPPGTMVKGTIRNLTSYGAFLELEEGLDGMIHVSDMSWTRKINHPSEVVKKGDVVEATVLEVDKANQRISLGMKQLGTDPWEKIDDLFKVGDLVSGKVTKLASFGAFVGLPNDIDGLVHISQVSEDRVDKIKNVLKVGDEVTARVIKIDRADRRIGLSIKAANYSTEQ
ncbi:MAG: 30S ribosomal protein S1, partial [Planctomyces sp.]